MKKYKVTLNKDERENLETLTSKCKHKSLKFLNALILLGCRVEYTKEKSDFILLVTKKAKEYCESQN